MIFSKLCEYWGGNSKGKGLTAKFLAEFEQKSRIPEKVGPELAAHADEA